jgi:carbon monoxide dehydrogenase subunit G
MWAQRVTGARAEGALRMALAAAEAVIPAPAGAVFAFLTDLDRHWELLPGVVEVVATGRTGATLRLRGPLGLRRTVRTRVGEVRPPLVLAGRAGTTARTDAAVSWSLTPRGGATHVRLAARVDRAAPVDRLLLAIGGRAWLARHFARAVERLGELTAAGPRAASPPRAAA